MAFKLKWTLIARRDLGSIVRYIAKDKSDAARRGGGQILKAVEVLEEMPNIGRVVPERGEESIREIVKGNYRIIYFIRQDTAQVEIWRIWHGARGTPKFDHIA